MTAHRHRVAQANDVNYELHSLGWKAFQNLCVTITGEIWGQVVQGFFDSRDGGRDGAFYGKWKSKEGEAFQGSFTIQCKFTAKSDKQLQLSDLSDELKKITRLAKRGLAENYFLFTNAHLTGTTEEEIRAKVEAIPGVSRFAGYGRDRISGLIRESPRLRMLVPRIYGLGDLSQILDERAQAQAKEILSTMGEDLAKFVITESYNRSAKALVEHGFVLLLGEPACGKSTIAASLSVGALDEWGCSVLKIRDADEFVAHSNPHEQKQLFWIDDAFGATQFDWSAAVNWNRVIPHMNTAIKRGSKIIFTSRDYIYRSARQHLKESAFPILRESQVVINVEQLTKVEREEILYNHIRLGSQPKKFKTQLKPFLPGIAEHRRFSPELARRLGNPIFTKKLLLVQESIDHFLSNPLELACDVIRNLDANCQSALALVFIRGGNLSSPVIISSEEEQALSRLGGSVASVFKSIEFLKDSLLLHVTQDGNPVWRFKHPTIRDAFATIIAESPELMDIYLSGTPVEKLLGEVSCGDVGLAGVKVIVPSSRFDAFTKRFDSFASTEAAEERKVHRFLSYRCNREYLVHYIALHPTFIDDLHVGSYLGAVSDVSVIERLHEFGLLPEEKRKAVVGTMRELAIDTPDSGFLAEDTRCLFTAGELVEILNHVRETLLPNLTDKIRQWRWDHNGTDDPANYFEPLVTTLKDYRKELLSQPEAIAQIDAALGEIEQAIEELQAEMPEERESSEYYGSTSQVRNDESRSIFDDVDQ